MRAPKKSLSNVIQFEDRRVSRIVDELMVGLRDLPREQCLRQLASLAVLEGFYDVTRACLKALDGK